MTPRGLNEPEEISADALSVRGFEQYRCDDYHLGKTCVFFIKSASGKIHLLSGLEKKSHPVKSRMSSFSFLQQGAQNCDLL